MKKELRFRRSEFSALIKLSIPILITQLLLIGMGVTDIAITGHYDTAVQASVGLGVMIWHPLFLFCIGVLMSIAILVAYRYGAGRHKEIATIWHNGLIITTILMVMVMTIMTLFSEYILRFVNADSQLIPQSVSYLRALSLGAPAILIFVSLRAVCEGISRPIPITIVSALGFVVNALLNYILVNGWPALHIKSYGIIGSGLGTAITFWVMLLFLLFFTKADYRLRELKLLRTPFRTHSVFRELLRVGLPNGATTFAEVAVFSAAGLILGRYAEKIVASHQISLAITSVTFMVPLSTAIALTALVGQRMGRKDYIGARRIGNMGRLAIFAIMLGTSILLYFSRYHIPILFNTDPIIIDLSATLIIYSIIFQLPDGLQVSANGVLRGMKDTKIPMLLSVTSYWLIAFPCCYYFGVIKKMAAEGVWIGLIIGLVCSAIMLNARLFVMNRNLQREVQMGNYQCYE